MIERSIARISEAALQVPADARAAHPTIPWRQVVGVGNVIRHDYEQIDDLVMWKTATERMLLSKTAVEAMVREID
jgi:uncharacterized protein with HEPN domain